MVRAGIVAQHNTPVSHTGTACTISNVATVNNHLKRQDDNTARKRADTIQYNTFLILVCVLILSVIAPIVAAFRPYTHVSGIAVLKDN